jgi:FkbM family methyltransferase
MDYSSPLAIQIRRVGQRLGILRPAVRLFRRILRKNYEDKFHDELLSAISPGSIVWDIGANVGFYTKLFSEKVGPTGRIVAFEPSPKTFNILREATKDHPEIVLHNIALSNKKSQATFYVSRTETADGATDSLAPAANAETHSISTVRGDSPELGAVPNVMKIDVEGFELEVLQGLSGILRNPDLRGLFVEMHFLEMINRGLKDAPQQIVNILKSAGFTVRWTDPSHIAAQRDG